MIAHSLKGCVKVNYSDVKMDFINLPGKEKKMLRKIIGFLLFWGGIFVLLVSPSQVVAQSSTSKLPQMISLTAYGVGSSGYVQASAIADALMKKLGAQIRVMPAGNDVSRLQPLKRGQVQFALTGVGGYYFAVEGMEDFASLDWGPQHIQTIWNVFPVGGSSLGTAKDAGIKTPYDLKGKRIFWLPGSPAFNITNTAILAFANLTWDDVVKVDYPSYSAALRGIVEGTCDGGFTTGTAATLYELESSRRGIWWPEFPASDVEGWKRLQAVAPYMIPMRNYGAPGIPPEGLDTMTYSYPMLLVYNSLDENLVYEVTKAIDEGFSLYKDAYPAMANWERSKAIVPSLTVPFHAGAVKYFREIGLWNKDFEAAQKRNLLRQDKLATAWNMAVSEAKAKGIKKEEFPAFWLKKRTEIK